jgi:hypothetical protein
MDVSVEVMRVLEVMGNGRPRSLICMAWIVGMLLG